LQALKEVRDKPGEKVLLFQDEASFYRQPSQGWLWAWMGRKQPKMQYSHRSNTRMRVVAFMEAVSGQVLSWDMSRVTVRNLARCIHQVSASFPQAENIYLVWDNWPVHEHHVVQEAIMKDPRIKVLPLPTYAPWLNAIEKLWRLVRQEIIHTHPWCDDFLLFRNAIRGKFQEFADGSIRLVHYCGLSY
jgi:hypothetical protein